MKRLEQIVTLIWKEFLQVVRDPSCLLVAFVLPLILLLIFGYGISLDMKNIKTAVVLEDRGPLAWSLYESLNSTEYIESTIYSHRREAEDALIDAKTRAVVIIPNDFSRRIRNGEAAPVQLLTDGSEANTAIILENYILGACSAWGVHQSKDRLMDVRTPIEIESRLRFNPEKNSRNGLIPGSIVIIMAMIGTLLTALVVAREWERGTMEAMLTMPIRKFDLIIGKLFPYYLLAMGSAAVCALLGVYLFGVPFRGSILAFVVTSTAFLFVALPQGLFISTILKNQFLAAQSALVVSFLPNYILSGVLFEIDSMPAVIRLITYVFPARYYAVCLQTIFMAGDIWPQLLVNCGYMLVIGLIATIATIIVTPKRLE